ncbi:hypothetical protein [Streptomyces sp. NPDC017529]|uniref:hypothetical protein n=1 Tax=Streptomyces sp. NPDC017529 TaxID=3365000 RepID=UPI00378C7B7C
MITVTLTLTGLFAVLWGLAGQMLGRFEPYQADGWIALGNGINAVSCAISGSTLVGMFAAAIAAWCGYRWWKGGGGDDTKRRLRAVRKAFSPVRRTAPQGAA